MATFTVTATATPNASGEWGNYYAVLNLVPGACVVEDPSSPSLKFDVVEENEELAFCRAKDLLTEQGLPPTAITVSTAELSSA